MKYVVMVLSVVVMLGACKKKTQECQLTPGNTSASAAEEKMVTDYIASNSIAGTAELETSGLYYAIDVQGNTNKPAMCSTVVVKYVGRFSNGTIFDQTQGTSTAAFTLGSLIEGWNRTISLIGEGGKIRIYVPSSLGYGASGSFNPNTGLYSIPPNSMLIFDIELVTVFAG